MFHRSTWLCQQYWHLNVKVTLAQAMKAQKCVEVEFRSYFNLGPWWGWVVSTTLRSFHFRERTGTHHAHRESWMGPGPVCTGAENLPRPGFDPRTVQPVTSRSADYANLATIEITTVFEIMEAINITLNSKKPSNYITVFFMFRQGTSMSLGSEMTTTQGRNYPRSSGNIK
jgi:hypothetical protein